MRAMTSAPSPQQQPITWDAVAPTYAEDAFQWAYFAEEALRIAPVSRTERVLDIACGPGTSAFLAAKSAARVDAVDFSPGMIEQVKLRAATEGVTNVHAAVMDAQSLEFPDATFDAAFCMFGFFFFPDRAKAFAELLRVLRPGGRAFMGTWAPLDRRPFMQIAFETIAEAVPQFPRPGKGDLQSTEECIREMSDAGFREVTSTTFTAKVRIESAEHYFDIMARSAAPLAAMRKKIGEEAFGAIRTTVVDALRKKVPEGGTELGAEAIFTRGVRPG
jgi:ubiquinone/menaquinone biosynthesis C-methylase UbiE